MEIKRDVRVDILRGIAITTMVAANAAPHLLIEPHPFYFRLYGTFAAAIFSILSGMMISFTRLNKKLGFGHFLKRGAMILMVGCLLDVFVWQMIPLVGVDILFLIGVATPIAYLISRLPNIAILACTAAFLLLGMYCQNVFGYYPNYSQEQILISLFPPGLVSPIVYSGFFGRLLNNWFVSGDFPLFPWLGMVTVGVLFGKLRYDFELSYTSRRLQFWCALALLGVGLPYWHAFPGLMATRMGWSELFYPPTLGYCLSAMGIALTLLTLLDAIKRIPNSFVAFFVTFGESSLFVYWMHEVLIVFGLNPLFRPLPMPKFIILYLSLLSILWGMARHLRSKKSQIKKWAAPVRFMFSS